MTHTPATTSQTLKLHDGRQLAWAEYGTPDGRPLLYFHGLPGSHVECAILHETALSLNLRVVAVDRPGYGPSSWQPQRRLLDWPGDVGELCDALQFERVTLLGVSGGGPCVLACAHAIPARIRAAAIVCGLGPVAVPELMRAMHWPARLAFRLAALSPGLLRALVGQPLKLLTRVAPESAIRLLALANGGADREVLSRPEVRSIFAGTLVEALRQGPRGAARDVEIYRRPWGFEPTDVRPHIQLWHGDADRVVPLAHGEYLHRQLPHSRLTVVPGEGHFSLPVRHAGAILEALVAARAPLPLADPGNRQ